MFFQIDIWNKLVRDLLPKRVLIVVSDKRVLSGFIDGRNEIPSCFTNTFKVLNIVRLECFNFLVFDICSHTDY